MVFDPATMKRASTRFTRTLNDFEFVFKDLTAGMRDLAEISEDDGEVGSMLDDAREIHRQLLKQESKLNSLANDANTYLAEKDAL